MTDNLETIQLLENKYVNTIRPLLSQTKFEQEFLINNNNNSNNNKPNIVKKSKKNILVLLKSLNPIRLLNVFTIFNLIAEYNIKQDLVADILSGITVGIMHVPAGLAYGTLTSLNAVNGLYVSFYSGITYILFGTSKHLSVGTYAVVSLMVYSAISKCELIYLETDDYLKFKNSLVNNSNNDNENADHIMKFKLKVATSLAFWCGLIQVLLAILRFGTIYKFLSNAMLRGFTTSAACIVFTTQIQHILGIYPKKNKSNLPVLKLLIVNIFTKFQNYFKNIF
jgi:MFS superfamily sulfate permease-like transporter